MVDIMNSVTPSPVNSEKSTTRKKSSPVEQNETLLVDVSKCFTGNIFLFWEKSVLALTAMAGVTLVIILITYTTIVKYKENN